MQDVHVIWGQALTTLPSKAGHVTTPDILLVLNNLQAIFFTIYTTPSIIGAIIALGSIRHDEIRRAWPDADYSPAKEYAGTVSFFLNP
jgi:hypothetical protein